MKRFKKSTIIIVTLLVVISVLRETGVITLNYYRFTTDTNTQSHWSANTTSFDLPMPKGYITGQERVSVAPIKVLSDGERIYYKPGEGLPVKIDLKGFNTWFTWIPFYKASSLHITANVNYGVGVRKGVIVNNAPGLRSIDGSIRGQISLTGDVSIIGFCSHRKASEIIGRKVAEEFAERTENYFSGLDY
jgi:hypothetical protein